MQRLRNRVFYYTFAFVSNIMVWGMFMTLSVPHTSATSVSSVVSTPPIPKVKLTATVGVPQRLVVPSLGMDIPLGTGQFDPATSSWTLSDDRAYYASVSTPANDSNGTTLLYGHARDTMFAPLARSVAGTEALVYTDNAYVFKYTFASMREVVPTDVSIFTDTGPPMLVMQTCSGPWDSYRALYTFSFLEVRKV